jgi:hypothetical protein
MCNRIRALAPLMVLVSAFTTAATMFSANRFTCARPPAPESRTH